MKIIKGIIKEQFGIFISKSYHNQINSLCLVEVTEKVFPNALTYILSGTFYSLLIANETSNLLQGNNAWS